MDEKIAKIYEAITNATAGLSQEERKLVYQHTSTYCGAALRVIAEVEAQANPQ